MIRRFLTRRLIVMHTTESDVGEKTYRKLVTSEGNLCNLQKDHPSNC